MTGSSRQVIDSPPKIGSILTIKFTDHYNNGTLRHPYFWRVRESRDTSPSDIFWQTNWCPTKRLLVRTNNLRHIICLSRPELQTGFIAKIEEIFLIFSVENLAIERCLTFILL